MVLSCMIVDDDKMSRLVLKQFIDKTTFLSLSHEVDNAKDALDILLKQSSNEVDVVFLDVEMPEMSGLEMVQKLETTYNVIIVSSKDQYALEAFEESVADYLMKPVEYDRLLQAVHKVQDRLKQEQLLAEKDDHVFVKCEGNYIRLMHNDILYIEALADYVIFHTKDKSYIVHCTMKRVDKKLPRSKFSRVHRSFIINRTKVDAFEGLYAHIGKKTVSIGASYKDRLMAALNIL